MFRKDSSFAPRMLLLPAALASVFALSGTVSTAYAQETASAGTSVPVHLYELKPGPLVQTLDAIQQASGQRIAFDRAALAPAQAGAVRGNLSAGAAVAQALSGTGYIMNEDGSGTLVVTAQQVVVTAKRDEAETSFKASRSDTATRSGSSLHLTPGSVTLITGKVLETQQVTDVTEALRNVSGVSFNQNPQGIANFEIRGFTASSTSNGVSDPHATTRGVYTVERIEVLKGPQAILSGGDSIGGGVNIVVKKPQAEPIRDLTLQYGSRQDKTVALDLSGPLSEDKRLTYRTVASVSDAEDSDAGFDGREHRSFMQAFRWKDRRTDFTLGAEYTKGHTPVMRYTFALRDGSILPPPERVLGHPADGFDFRNRRVHYQLEQQLTENAVLVSRLQHARDNFDVHALSPNGFSYAAGAAPNAPRADMTFYGSRSFRNDSTTSGDHYLRLGLRTGPLRHKLSIGYNHTDLDYSQTQLSGPDLSVPVYAATPYVFQDLRQGATSLVVDGHDGQNQKAAYIQDLISYEKWNLLLNWRRNRYTVKDSAYTFYPDKFVYSAPAEITYSTTPGAGIVYQLTDQTTLYASYAQGFDPQNFLQCGGGVVPPNETRNREVGAKFDLLDSRFALTTSLFSMQQSNSLVYFQPGNCYNVRDAQRTRGAEIDAQGRLAPGLEAVFNYTYTKIEDVGSSTAVFPGRPKHKMSLWALYDFQSAALKGFSAGLGVSASSRSLGSRDPRAQFHLPGQAQVDTSLRYSGGPWALTFGITNLFDRTLYSTTVSNSFIPVNAGRAFMLTVKRSFK